MKFCGFQEFGKERAYFNFNEQNLHHVAAMGLKVASGYKAAMDVYNGEKILLCSELCHKLLNFKTCYEIMNDLYRDNPQGFREAYYTSSNYLKDYNILSLYILRKKLSEETIYYRIFFLGIHFWGE